MSWHFRYNEAVFLDNFFQVYQRRKKPNLGLIIEYCKCWFRHSLNFEKTYKKSQNEILRNISMTIVDISQNSFPTVLIMQSNCSTEFEFKINGIKHFKFNNKYRCLSFKKLQSLFPKISSNEIKVPIFCNFIRTCDTRLS